MSSLPRIGSGSLTPQTLGNDEKYLLPIEISEKILASLGLKDILSASRVSTDWNITVIKILDRFVQSVNEKSSLQIESPLKILTAEIREGVFGLSAGKSNDESISLATDERGNQADGSPLPARLKSSVDSADAVGNNILNSNNHKLIEYSIFELRERIINSLKVLEENTLNSLEKSFLDADKPHFNVFQFAINYKILEKSAKNSMLKSFSTDKIFSLFMKEGSIEKAIEFAHENPSIYCNIETFISDCLKQIVKNATSMPTELPMPRLAQHPTFLSLTNYLCPV